MFRKIRRAGVSGSLVLASMMPISVLANDDTIGALYTMSNAAEGNSVLMYNRDHVGKLTPAGEFYTDGLGTGTGLGNQGAVILDPANRWLFVVNGLAYAVYLAWSGEWRHIVPDRHTPREAGQVVLHDLHSKYFRRPHLYVGLSRVTRGSDIRLAA